LQYNASFQEDKQMPKTRKAKPRGSAILKADPLRFKFKLGGRKNQTSALLMSTDELVSKYETARPRDKGKIMQVLHTRGVHLGTSAEEELLTENED